MKMIIKCIIHIQCTRVSNCAYLEMKDCAIILNICNKSYTIWSTLEWCKFRKYCNVDLFSPMVSLTISHLVIIFHYCEKAFDLKIALQALRGFLQNKKKIKFYGALKMIKAQLLMHAIVSKCTLLRVNDIYICRFFLGEQIYNL